MIELYVILTLLGIGYVFNQNKQVKMNQARQINKHELPNRNMQPIVQGTERMLANKMFKPYLRDIEFAKLNANKTPSSTHTQRVVGKGISTPQSLYKSPLSGRMTDMTHNNMMPFGNVRQNIDTRANTGSIMEHMNGSQEFYKQKQEREPLFELTDGYGNVNGNSVSIPTQMEYFEKPRTMNNYFPIDRVTVGPGLNKGFSAKPTGGFQQIDARDYAMPKSTNELRAANKPKETFEGRVVDGQKGSVPGKIGQIAKNRVETFFENTEDMLLKTTGAYLKDAQRPKEDVKITNRIETTREYSGVAFQKSGDQGRPLVQDPLKTQLQPYDVANATIPVKANSTKDDYGKASIMVYANERDVTTTRTHQGGLTSIVKAIIAPLEDVVRVAKKEYLVDHPRTFGELQPQAPSKLAVRDPNDVARTTIKETLIHDADRLNLKGPTKITVIDHNQVARTTIKETLIHDADKLNLKGPTKLTIYDPNDVARTTMKETMIHDATGYSTLKPPTYAPAMYQDQDAKATIRQTVDPIDTTRNMRSVLKQTVYDPNDVARTTIKETTLDNDNVGIVERTDRKIGAYLDEYHDVKTTQKEILSNIEYSGNPAKAATDGYQVANMDARPTQKEILSDKEHFGMAATQSAKGVMSYDDMYNAVLNDLREPTLEGRAPTSQGAKVALSGDDITVDVRKVPIDEPAERAFTNVDRVIQPTTNVDLVDASERTRDRQKYDIDDRLDVSILNQLEENPFALNLASDGED